MSKVKKLSKEEIERRKILKSLDSKHLKNNKS